MSRLNLIVLVVVLFVVLVVLGGVVLFKGGFYIVKYEGDMLYLIDIVLWMVEG